MSPAQQSVQGASALSRSMDRAKGLMSGFTPGQRGVVVVGVLGLLLGAVALTSFVSRPSFAQLYGNLSGPDASAVICVGAALISSVESSSEFTR